MNLSSALVGIVLAFCSSMAFAQADASEALDKVGGFFKKFATDVATGLTTVPQAPQEATSAAEVFTPEPTRDTPVYFKGSLASLVAERRRNEIAYDKKFVNQVVEFTAVIENVYQTNREGLTPPTPFIWLQMAPKVGVMTRDNPTCYCDVPGTKSQKMLENSSREQTVTIRARITNRKTNGIGLQFWDCEVLAIK